MHPRKPQQVPTAKVGRYDKNARGQLMVRRSGIAMAVFFLLASAAWAQDNTYEISLGGSAVVGKQSSGNGTVLTPTNSGAVLVTGRYRFSAHSSIAINYSHTSNSQIYVSGPLTY